LDCPQLDFGGPKLDLRLQVVSAGGRPPDGAPWRGADRAGAMRRGEGSGRSSGAPFSGKIRPREGLLHPPRRRIGAQRRRIGHDVVLPGVEREGEEELR